MNKTDLIIELSSRMHVTRSQSKEFIETFQTLLSEALKKEGVILQGFGGFERWNQSERAGRNPRNGVACTIKSRTSVKFKPGKHLLEFLNS